MQYIPHMYGEKSCILRAEKIQRTVYFLTNPLGETVKWKIVANLGNYVLPPFPAIIKSSFPSQNQTKPTHHQENPRTGHSYADYLNQFTNLPV